MSLSFRRGMVVAILCATVFLAACEQVTPTPRPTPTRPVATEVIVATDTPTDTPTAVPTTTPTAVPAKVGGAQIPKLLNLNPLLPIFGPFPPEPIPSRPANIDQLTGLTADPAMLQRRPILARIGNDPLVRESNWQAGLNSADIVFEELIDILGSNYANTRYTAVFLSKDPPLIGPIRSERIVNFQMAPMLNGALANAGGSNGTRWLFSQTPIVNLDEYFNQPAYCYIPREGKLNYVGRLYTTGPRLRQYLTQKGWEKPIPLFGFTFSDPAPAGQPVKTIAFDKAPWPSFDAAQWQYDSASGKYLRFSTGAPVMDDSYPVTAQWGHGVDCTVTGPETKTQVSTSNIVVLYAKHEKTDIIEDSNNSVSVHITLTGQGDARFFRDGVMVTGKWQRQNEQEFFHFTDSSGNPYSLKPGNTFFEIVPLGFQLDLK